MDNVILISEFRENIIENQFRGRICITGNNGKTVYSIGNSKQLTFFRSVAKPIQVLPFLMYGLDEKYDLEDSEIAIIAGSHADEDYHEENLEKILKKIGIIENDLIMLPTYSFSDNIKYKKVFSHLPPRKLANNCAGKHIGLMAMTKEFEGSYLDYWKVGNAAQREIISCISLLSEINPESIGVGVDGCGVPVYALGLDDIARCYFKLACPEEINELNLQKATKKLVKVMHRYPEMIAGTGLICTILNSDPNIVAKAGAKGVYAMGLRKEKLGIAFKIESGEQYPLAFIALNILQQLHYDNKYTIDALEKICGRVILNECGKKVGSTECEFKLVKLS
ncbi:MAG: asparaginase [Ruminiclostridium sp.]